MLATILIVIMILLQTGALSLGLMVDRRFITAAASLNRKSAHSTYITGNGTKGRRSRKQGGAYAFSSTRTDPDRGGFSPRVN